MTEELRAFFEQNPLATQAAGSIKNGREIGIEITGEGAPKAYTFTKESGKNVLKDEKASSPDLIFRIPEASAKELVTKKFDSVGQVGLHIFEKMLSNDNDQKIQAKLNIGFLGLVSGGYLGVLSSGGGEVAKFLATKGLSSMGKLKETLSKMKSGN